MNIRYKAKGIAFHFTLDNLPNIQNIPELWEPIRERFNTLEEYIQDVTTRHSGLIKAAGTDWLVIPFNHYFVSIEGIDLILSEQDFKELFEEAEEAI